MVAAIEIQRFAPADGSAEPRRSSLRSVTPRATYRRRRMTVAASAVALLSAVAAAVGVVPGRSGGESPPVPERPVLVVEGSSSAPGVYVVQPGDTFWSIAVRLAPDRDPRRLVDEMVAAHGTARLLIGERLVLGGP